MCLLVDRLYPGKLAKLAVDAFPLPWEPSVAAHGKRPISFTASPVDLFALLLDADLVDMELRDLDASLLQVAAHTFLDYAKVYAEKERTSGVVASGAPTPSADALEEYDMPITNVYVSLPSSLGWCWTEVFESGIQLLESMVEVAPSLEATVSALKECQLQVLGSRKEYSRRLGLGDCQRIPLQWQKKRVESIRMFTPKFQENFHLDRKNQGDPDAERAQQQKTRVLHRREMKGAIRELRKDASFLAGEKTREKKQTDQSYQKKIKRVYGLLGQEQGEANTAERQRGNKKRK